MRSVIAISAGLFSGLVILLAFQFASDQAFPAPQNLSQLTPEQLADYVKQLPWPAFALVLAGWFFAAVDGSLIASWLAPHRPMFHAAVICTVFLILAMSNLILNPHPFWMVLVTPFVSIAAFLCGGLVGKRLHATRVK